MLAVLAVLVDGWVQGVTASAGHVNTPGSDPGGQSAAVGDVRVSALGRHPEPR